MSKLKWRGRHNQSKSGRYRAYFDPYYKYWRARYEGRPFIGLGFHSTREAAKQACQEHYNNINKEEEAP